jgi:hypothetical protein
MPARADSIPDAVIVCAADGAVAFGQVRAQ